MPLPRERTLLVRLDETEKVSSIFSVEAHVRIEVLRVVQIRVLWRVRSYVVFEREALSILSLCYVTRMHTRL